MIFEEKSLGVTIYRDDEHRPVVLYLHKHHNSGDFSLQIQFDNGNGHTSATLTRDQLLWLASAAVEATAPAVEVAP